MVNQSVINAYKSRYTQAQLETALDAALADHASGIVVTQVTFEGGGSSGRPITGDPSYLIEHLQTALEQIADPDKVNQPNSTSFDLSKRAFGT